MTAGCSQLNNTPTQRGLAKPSGFCSSISSRFLLRILLGLNRAHYTHQPRYLYFRSSSAFQHSKSKREEVLRALPGLDISRSQIMLSKQHRPLTYYSESEHLSGVKSHSENGLLIRLIKLRQPQLSQCRFLFALQYLTRFFSTDIVMSSRGSGVLPRRRNGKQQACEPCRKAKIACDHSLPQCHRCSRRKIAHKCEYLDAPM